MRLLEGYSTLYTSLSIRVSRIGAKLVCLSVTSKQAKVAPECCHAVQWWKWRCPLTIDPLLSAWIVIEICCVRPTSKKNFAIQSAWIVACVKAMYSDSTVDKATVSCCLLFQDTISCCEARNIFRPKIKQILWIHTPRSRTKIELPAR